MKKELISKQDWNNHLTYNFYRTLFHATYNSRSDSCVNTVGDTSSILVKPWFSLEAGKDFRKRENGGEWYHLILGEEAIE